MGAALHEELTTLMELQAAVVARPEAWRVVRARVGSVAGWWLLQIALAVAAAGLPSAARDLLVALPGLPGQPAHEAMLNASVVDVCAARLGAA